MEEHPRGRRKGKRAKTEGKRKKKEMVSLRTSTSNKTKTKRKKRGKRVTYWRNVCRKCPSGKRRPKGWGGGWEGKNSLWSNRRGKGSQA